MRKVDSSAILVATIVSIALTACGCKGDDSGSVQANRGTVEERIDRIQNNPDMPPERKRQLIEDIKAMAAKDPSAPHRQ